MSKQPLGFKDPVDIKVIVERNTRDALQHICDEINKHVDKNPSLTVPQLVRNMIDDQCISLKKSIKKAIDNKLSLIQQSIEDYQKISGG